MEYLFYCSGESNPVILSLWGFVFVFLPFVFFEIMSHVNEAGFKLHIELKMANF